MRPGLTLIWRLCLIRLIRIDVGIEALPDKDWIDVNMEALPDEPWVVVGIGETGDDRML